MIAPTNAEIEHDPTSAKPTDVEQSPPQADGSDDKPRRRSTSHLKLVPETLEQREYIKSAAEQYARTLDRSRPFNKAELEGHSRKLLEQLNQPEKFLGFAMVLVGQFLLEATVPGDSIRTPLAAVATLPETRRWVSRRLR
jgi:hypothetical protein